MNTATATITLAVIAILMLEAGSGQIFVQAKIKQTSNEQIKSISMDKQSDSLGSAESLSVLDQFSPSPSVSALQTNTASNPLVEKEEFDITVTNIKHENITVALTVDGLRNSTIIPANPPNVITPTSKVVIFKFDRHEHASTPAVLPIKLGDQYTACISFTSNKEKASCLAASIDSITQPQKKSLDTNYIPF